MFKWKPQKESLNGMINEYATTVHEHTVVLKEEDNGWVCDGKHQSGGCVKGCTGFNQSAGWRRWQCAQCNFDLCSGCVNKYKKAPEVPMEPLNGMLNTYTTTLHEHMLSLDDLDSGWACDGKNQPGGCVKGCTGFHQTTGWRHWRCAKCNYDLCSGCVNKYKKAPEAPMEPLNGMLNTYTTTVHEHLLSLDELDSGWACDGKNQPGGCVKGCTGFHQTTGWRHWRCAKCNYDLCSGCVKKYISDGVRTTSSTSSQPNPSVTSTSVKKSEVPLAVAISAPSTSAGSSAKKSEAVIASNITTALTNVASAAVESGAVAKVSKLVLSSEVAKTVLKEALAVSSHLPIVGGLIQPLSYAFDRVWQLCENAKSFKDHLKQFLSRLRDIAMVMYNPPDGLIHVAARKNASASLKDTITEMEKRLATLARNIEPYANLSTMQVMWNGPNKLNTILNDVDKSLTDLINALSLSLQGISLNIQFQTYDHLTVVSEGLNELKDTVEKQGLSAVAANDRLLQNISDGFCTNIADIKTFIQCQLLAFEDTIQNAIKMKVDTEEARPKVQQELTNLTEETMKFTESPMIDYTMILGRGSFGTVYEGKYHNEVVAVKVLERDATEVIDAATKREVGIHMVLSKLPGVVRIFGADVHNGHYTLVMEKADEPLSNAIYHKQESWNTLIKLTILSQVAHALDSVHRLGYIHRDVKPLNVLLFYGNNVYDVKAKICDFGFAKGVSMNTSNSKAKGTPAYMAPETLSREYGPACDVYSFGIMSNEIFTNVPPYADFKCYTDFEFFNMVREGERPKKFDASASSNPVEIELVGLIESMWNNDPKARPSFEQISRILDDILPRQSYVARYGSSSLGGVKPARSTSPTPAEGSIFYQSANSSSKKLQLSVLSVAQVSRLMQSLDMPCDETVKSVRINGAMLNEMSKEEIPEVFNLKSFQTRVLINQLEDLKKNGVATELVKLD